MLPYFLILQTIFMCYSFWMSSGSLPDQFNVSWLWILPEGKGDNDTYYCKNTRTLSGANTDAKCLAYALAHSFNLVIDKWAVSLQRGFIRGRNILRNILDILLDLGLLLPSWSISLRPSLPSPRNSFGLFFIGLGSLLLLFWLLLHFIETTITFSAFVVS